MIRKIVLVVGLCAGLSLFGGVPGVSAAEGVVVSVPGDDLTVLNAALDELTDILLKLQADLANSSAVSKDIDVAAVTVALSQISVNLNSISVALGGANWSAPRHFAEKEITKIAVGKDIEAVPVLDDGNSVKALSLEFLSQYKSASFTLLAMLLVFGVVVFLRRGTTESSSA